MCPKRLTSNCSLHVSSGGDLDGCVDLDPGVVDHRTQRSSLRIIGDARCKCVDVFANGNVQHHRFDSLGTDRIGVPVSSDAGENVVTAKGELTGRGSPNPCRGTGDVDEVLCRRGHRTAPFPN